MLYSFLYCTLCSVNACVFFYLAHLPEQHEGSLQRLVLFSTQNSVCGGAAEDAVFARALGDVLDQDVRDLRQGKRERGV